MAKYKHQRLTHMAKNTDTEELTHMAEKIKYRHQRLTHMAKNLNTDIKELTNTAKFKIQTPKTYIYSKKLKYRHQRLT